MAQSLVKLTLESNQYEKNLRQAKKNLDDFTKQIGINTKALSGVAVAAAAVTGAMKVMKDAFMASEKMVDEWGRTVESVKSVYEGFLNGLNNGDVSGFLSRIDSIVKAAREAYDAIDTLGTLKTIQSPQIAKRQAENDRIRTMLQTGRYIAPAEGSGLKATMATGALLSDSQKKNLERQLENGMKEMVKLAGNEVKATGDAIDAVYNRFGAELGMSVKEFRQGTSSWEEFTKRLEGAKKYSDWQSANSSSYVGTGGVLAVQGGGKNPYSEYKGWDKFRVDGNRYKELVQLIQQREQQIGQIYSMQGQAYRTINRTEGIKSRIGGGKSGSGKAKETYAEDSIAAQRELVSKLTKQYENAGASVRDGIKKQLDEANKALDLMLGKSQKVEIAVGFSGATDNSMKSWISAQQNALGNLEKGSSEYLSVYNNIVDTQSLQSILDKAIKNDITISPDTVESLWEKILGGENIPDSVFKSLEDDINSMIDEMTIKSPLQRMMDELNILKDELDKSPDSATYQERAKKVRDKEKEIGKFKGEKNEVDLKKEIGDMAGGISSMVGSLNQLGIDIPEGLTNVINGIQIVTTILTAISTIVATIQAISAADALIPFFARGGIVKHAAGGWMVPGHDYSDRTPVMVSSGELILNKAQQGNLASQLEGGAFGNLELTARVSAEQIDFVTRNRRTRQGKGEILTTKNRKQ